MPETATPHRAPTIAILVDYLAAAYQVTIVRAAQRAAKKKGVSLLVVLGRALDSPTFGDIVQNRIYELLGPRNVDGLLLVSGCLASAAGTHALSDFCRRYRPLPLCSIGLGLPGIPSLTVSNFQGSRAVVEHLLSAHGAKRIAYVAGPSTNPEAAERLDGYKTALHHAGVELDSELIDYGDFCLPTGLSTIQSMLKRGTQFDAVVAANDYMALGAMQALREHGLRVPEDVRLAGFDDSPFSRFTVPSLTTVRQPLERMARLAVNGIVASALHGAAMPLHTSVDVEVVSRQSCGCGLETRQRTYSLPPDNPHEDLASAVLRRRDGLLRLLHERVGVPPDALGAWAPRLLDALHKELSGEDGKFLATFTAVLESAQTQTDYTEELAKVIGLLRSELRNLHPPRRRALDLEQIWYVSQMAASNAAAYAQGREKLELQLIIDAARIGFERIGSALNRPTLRDAIVRALVGIGIRRASLSLFDEHSKERLIPFVTVEDGIPTPSIADATFEAEQLVPAHFFSNARHSHILVPLSFDSELYGVMALEYSSHETVYGLLRNQISSALKGGLLHRAALKKAALLERAEREQLQQESKIAARIQTALFPTQYEIDGLEISAQTEPAVDVGGDYFDVIVTEGGGWLGIGDVTGHGLIAGIVMLMLQGMVAAMTRHTPMALPSELVVALNRALHGNIRGRLGRDDHATLTLLRYERDGTITYAGAHEELIIWRQSSESIETVETTGVWSGTLPDVSSMTTDATLRLEDGDVLVLYTDGVTEAMNELKEHFGLERLCQLVKANATQAVGAITRAVTDAVAQWQTRQLDDVTIVVARYHASDPKPHSHT